LDAHPANLKDQSVTDLHIPYRMGINADPRLAQNPNNRRASLVQHNFEVLIPNTRTPEGSIQPD
jgi:hypothetical protein